MMLRSTALALAVVLVLGCTLADVQVNVVSERTSLENQVLGSYNALADDVLLVASVRGMDPLGRVQTAPRRSREFQNAVEAMQTLAFHADDVEAFKRLGWVGENNEGLLTAFTMDKEDVAEDLRDFALRYKPEEFEAVVADVNGARAAIMQRVIETNVDFSQADLPRIRQVFAKINRENALRGEKIQTEKGSWTEKQ
jgi:uncharacterized protein YdbL (DUF1318 family)